MIRSWRSRTPAAALMTAAWLLGGAVGCARSRPSPAALDTANEDCTRCRMRVSDPHFAAQIVAPGDEPRFFDDVGCFVDYLSSSPPAAGAVAYVADHRTGEWTLAATAVYTRVARLETPMGSHLVAHVSADSRAADRAAAAGDSLTAAQVFGARRVPDGTQK